MKTQVMTFRISNSFEEWSKNFDSHLKIQKAAGMTPLFRGPHENDPQKVCIVMQENEAEILKSGHILETTEVNNYL